jgi:head-tail adaptor
MSEFAGTLAQRVRIERPAALRTAGGLQAGGWEEVASCLAEIVPEGVGAEAEGQVLSAMPRFRVTIRARDGIAVGQRVKWRGRAMLIRSSGETMLRRNGSWESGIVRGAELQLGGQRVLAERQPAIAGPAGGTVADVESRAAISAILAALQAHGLIET